MNPIKPTKEAMLLCDSVITEVGTGKKSLIGIFENIITSKCPFSHYRLSVYLKFTSTQGKYVFRLELVDLDKNVIIGKANAPELDVPNKLDSYELTFNLENLAFQHPGKYEFRVYAGDAMFASKTFRVVESKPVNQNQ